MTDIQVTLEEFAHWTLTQSMKSVDASPAEFIRQKRMERILAALADHLNGPRDDRYPLEEYLEVQDVEWIIAQGAAAKSLDRTE